MKKILIGTTNSFRYSNLKSMLLEINPNFEIINESLDIVEKEFSSTENAEIKAKAYFKHYKINVLCVDEGIFLDDEDYSPKVMVKRDKNGREISNQNLIGYWKEVLKSRSLSGYLEKSYALMKSEDTIYKNTIKYQIELRYSDKINYYTNPLNNFIFPNGFTHSISNFTSEELKTFREKQKLAIVDLLSKANLIYSD
jgi:hypothetical protein